MLPGHGLCPGAQRANAASRELGGPAGNGRNHQVRQRRCPWRVSAPRVQGQPDACLHEARCKQDASVVPVYSTALLIVAWPMRAISAAPIICMVTLSSIGYSGL